ncbi:MAG: cellulase family glycosylhydrolase [Caulobacterales bacterium]|nr:cellulase family glycosylhydrolase [Caulobacterales bacterium]
MRISPVRQHGGFFLDAAGRQVMLRGVNLGGDCKVPYPDGGTHHPSDFADHREVSFIGRPFPLAEADAHLGRLRRWGFNVVRLLTTWEAVEHAGPGVYDEAYLDYFAEVCRRAGEHGLYVFVDFHQDVWSRMSGGDGAPGWTFEAVGLDFTRFPAAGAAHVMQAQFDYASGEARQAAYPQMSWGSNYRLPANGIMWSLFWAGRRLTPDFSIGGENVQDLLQGSYLRAMDQVAQRIAGLPNALGFDTLNEPGTGWIGEPLSYRHLAPSGTNPTRPRLGPAMSPLDNLAVAAGLAVTVPVLTRDPATGATGVTETRTINPQGVRIWREGATDPFEQAGAWAVRNSAPVALREDFFCAADGQALDLSEDGYGPLFRAVDETIRRRNPDWSVFAELDPFGAAAGRRFPREMPERSVNAGHWYDVATLFLKRFNPRGRDPETIRTRFVSELGALAAASESLPGGAPTLVGEFGIPFDLDGGRAYDAWAGGQREGVWDEHVTALGVMYDALDALQLHSTQWNYTVSNRNDARIGDGWNQEDLSIYSADQVDDPADPDGGGRAVAGFCRPYAQALQGRLVEAVFDRAGGRFTLRLEADPEIDAPTEIYVPKIQFPQGFVVHTDGAAATVEVDAEAQRVLIAAQEAGQLTVTLDPAT